MKPLEITDLVDIAAYELERQEFRSKILNLKRARRVQVGEMITLVFENRDTVRFQIQEMMRAERIVRPDRVAEELSTYNQLIPEPGCLSATLFIEIQDQVNLRSILNQFIGIDHGRTTWLTLGDESVEGVYEGGHSKENRVSAVHYVTFKMSAPQISTFNTPGQRITITVDHGDYLHTVELPRVVQERLIDDLS